MDGNANGKQGDGAFRAILHPHRSLDPRGFLILMLAIGTISFVMGAVFLSMGAWPVFGFFGLDVLLIYVAFRLNYRSGRAYEIVELTPALLTLTLVEPSGRQKSFEFNPYWVRVRLSERPDGRTNLRIASHGREFEFARCLNDDERREFAHVLEGALATARTTSAIG
jgi:uncharacterized membrane protein